MATPAEILQAIWNGPALEAPAGASYQFDNPPNMNTMCLSVLGVFLSLSIVDFCVRIYTKWTIHHSLVKEDYCLFLGMLLFIVYGGIAIKLVYTGAGVHQWDIQVKNLKPLLFYTYTAEIVYGFGISFVKASIPLQYLRIFHQVNKRTFMYIACWATISLTVLFYMIAVFITIFSCTPRAKFWDPLITTGHCLNNGNMNIATGSFNLISDIALVLLPQYEIWKLRVSRKKKARIAAVFLVALCACVTSVVRLYYSVKAKQTGDFTYNVAFLGSTTLAEASIGIICSCLPVLPKFYQTIIRPKIQTAFWTKERSKSENIRQFSFDGREFDSRGGSMRFGPAKGPYSVFDGSELQGFKTAGSEVLSTIRVEDVRDDEGGENGAGEMGGIRMMQEVRVEGSWIRDGGLDLEGQGKVRAAEMGW